MLRTAALLIAVFVFPITSPRQEKSPSVETCRADLADWGNADLTNSWYRAEFSSDIPNSTPVEKLPVTEIRVRMKEMYGCRNVDSTRQESYFSAAHFYGNVQANRWAKFISRHDLNALFESEDAAGKR
jgi:hypothetical protein